jgi:ABC-2 type transport system permease protein
MWRQVLALIVKELLAVLRDAKSRSVLISPPIVMLILFGYAATYDLDRVPIAIYNQDASEASRIFSARRPSGWSPRCTAARRSTR